MRILFLVLFMSIALSAVAQDDMLDALQEEATGESYNVSAIFKGTRLINGHTVETRPRKNLDFLISHRFGEISGGAYQFFGFDQSTVRFGFDYGVTDHFNIGIGRNSFEKTFDGYLKYKLLSQAKGEMSVPVTVTLFTSAALRTLKGGTFEGSTGVTDRLVYTHQVLIARKFSPSFSFQLMPSFVHFNVITTEQVNNDIYALGAGGRMKLTKRLSLNAEYYYQFQQLTSEMVNAFAIGFDIETGGHVFQLHFTNSQSMIEKGFIAETRNDFFNGDIHFGFNISRTFQLGKKDKW